MYLPALFSAMPKRLAISFTQPNLVKNKTYVKVRKLYTLRARIELAKYSGQSRMALPIRLPQNNSN